LEKCGILRKMRTLGKNKPYFQKIDPLQKMRHAEKNGTLLLISGTLLFTIRLTSSLNSAVSSLYPEGGAVHG